MGLLNDMEQICLNFNLTKNDGKFVNEYETIVVDIEGESAFLRDSNINFHGFTAKFRTGSELEEILKILNR